MNPSIESFFHEDSGTIAHLVADPGSGHAAIIDSVLDFDARALHTSTAFADRIAARARERGLTIDWILETHVHADHLTAAPHLQDKLGGRIAIGAGVTAVQETFARLFNAEPGFATDGSQFDRLLADEETLSIGALTLTAWHTPGHTPACASYLVGDAVFVGDTLFMEDFGTARCDFPGGDARRLYRSIQRLLALPEATRMFLCHDYAPGGRAPAWETTVGAQRAGNTHLEGGVDEDAFVATREARDATLLLPRLIFPSVQVNMRAGRLPPAEANGIRYLKLPLNAL